jgi:transposase
LPWLHLDHLGRLEARIGRLTARIGEWLGPPPGAPGARRGPRGPEAAEGGSPAGPGEAVSRLTSLPGVSRRTAEVVAAEAGADMGAFPTAGRLASWAGRCPGSHESAGQRHGGRARRGNRWLKQALVQAAWAATRLKKGRLPAYYRGLARRRGRKRALIALAHTLLVTRDHWLQKGTTYQDPLEKAA